MAFPQTPTTPPQQYRPARSSDGFSSTEQSIVDATNRLSMVTNADQEVVSNVSSFHHIQASAATDSDALFRLLHFERQLHQATLESLQGREQRMRVIEEELQCKTDLLGQWAHRFSRWSSLLRQKDHEIQQLRSRVEMLENKVRKSYQHFALLC